MDSESAKSLDLEYVLDEDVLIADYISAVRRNDLTTVQRLLEEHNALKLDAVGSDGKYAIQIALENQYTDISTLLFSRGVKIGLTLLRLIENDCSFAVALICKHKQLFKLNGEDIFEVHDTDDEFLVETTPLNLAARKNRFQILKILLTFGAKMQTLDEVRLQFANNRPGRARAVFHLCEAISSEAYLLQTSDNLLQSVFETMEKIRQIRQEENKNFEEQAINDGYSVLEKRLKDMLMKILDLVNREEVATILMGDDLLDSEQNSSCLLLPEHLPRRLWQALDLNNKKFVTHTKCQEYILERWHLGFEEHVKNSALKRCLATCFLSIFWPILGVIYLIYTTIDRCSTLERFIQSPYVKFVLNTSSRITFLILITFEIMNNTTFNITGNVTAEKLKRTYVNYKTHSTVHLFIVWAWIVGMTWRELTKVRRQGLRMYTTFGWSQVEIPQLLLYWVYIICNAVAWIEAVLRVNSGEIENLTTNKNLTVLLSSCDMSQINGSSDCMQYLTHAPQIELESRLDWYAYEPLLIAEAAFAVANVLTFVRLLDVTVLIGHLGVLQVSLWRMFRAVVKFLCLYAFIWASFSLGLSQLYRPYEDVRQKHCQNMKETDCEATHFTNIFTTMEVLFLTLFKITDYNYLNLPPNLHMTETVGKLIFALYLLLTMTFLMNMLIAMLGGVFASTESNADAEWKFARSIIMCESVIDPAAVPPPLNLLPSAASLSACCGYFVKRRKKQQQNRASDQSQVEMKDLKRRTTGGSSDYQITSAAVKRRYIRDIMKRTTFIQRRFADDAFGSRKSAGILAGSGKANGWTADHERCTNKRQPKSEPAVCHSPAGDVDDIQTNTPN